MSSFERASPIKTEITLSPAPDLQHVRIFSPTRHYFQTAAGRASTLTGNAMWQQGAYRMIQRRARRRRHQDKDRKPHLPRDWHHRVPEEQRKARSRAAHADEISLDEVERIAI